MSADRFGRGEECVPPPDGRVLVVGNVLAAGIAARLGAESANVRLLTDDDRAIRRVGSGVEVTTGDPTDVNTLRQAVDGDQTLVVVAGDDGRTLLIARLADVQGAGDVFAVVRDPETVDPFRDAGVQPLCTSSVLASSLLDRLSGDDEAR